MHSKCKLPDGTCRASPSVRVRVTFAAGRGRMAEAGSDRARRRCARLEKPVATERKRPVISDGLPSQLPDIDPEETLEWIESLDGVIDERGRQRARYVML